MFGFVDFFHQIFSPPMLLFTVMLLIVLLYWIVVICGMIDIEILDFGDVDLDLDVDIDGAVEDIAEGAGEAIEGASNTASTMQTILGFLNIGTVPVTIVISVVVFQMWVMAYLANMFLPNFLKNLVPLLVFAAVLFILLFIVSLFIAGFTTRPFKNIFKIHTTHGHGHLVGKICKVKTSNVTPSFGQGEIVVKNSHLLLSIRAEEKNDLKKGDEAVILKYNSDKDTYNVKEM